MARANPQWRDAAGQPVLIIFSGPHAYISPRWYAEERVVPTWNYVAVHAYGTLELIEEPAAVLDLLRRTASTYEAAMPEPWSFNGPADFLEQLAAQIVAFRIPIDRLEGKWKLNQNHPIARRERVVAALDNSASADSQAMARLMRETLGR